MKKIFFTTLFTLIISTNISLSSEKPCSQFDKMKEAYKYRKCKAELKSGSDISKKKMTINEKYKALRKKLAPPTGAELWKKSQEKKKEQPVKVEDRLKSLNIKLPKAPDPVGAYVASKISGNLIFISGQVSLDSNGKLISGKVGKDLNLEQAQNAAKICGLNILAQLKKICDGDLDKVKSCIKLTGYVNSTDDFKEQPKVINGASDLISSVFENTGKHTRAAVSVNSLPLGAAVEIDGIFEI